MKKTQLLLLSVVAAATVLHAETYDFKDPKGVNNARFNLDAPLEAISGTASGISGTIEFDPEAVENTSGTIEIAVDSMTVPNSTMQGHLTSEDWLHGDKHPTITFTAKSVNSVKMDGDRIQADVTGDLTIKGITREITIPVTFMHLPGRLSDRTNGAMKGDLLVVRSDFTVERSPFNIMPGKVQDKVAEEIEISFAIAGAAPEQS